VLVHGAWADGSSWDKVAPLLEAKGCHVVAVHEPLTSLADDEGEPVNGFVASAGKPPAWVAGIQVDSGGFPTMPTRWFVEDFDRIRRRLKPNSSQ
jgi:hypothetical protein